MDLKHGLKNIGNLFVASTLCLLSISAYAADTQSALTTNTSTVKEKLKNSAKPDIALSQSTTLKFEPAAKQSFNNSSAAAQVVPMSVAIESRPSASAEEAFIVPAERTLAGLAGTLDVAVSADARGDFASGMAAIEGEGAQAVEVVSVIDLTQAVASALGFSRDVLVAEARSDQATAQSGQARAFLLPSLLINLKGGREKSTPGAQIDPTTGGSVASSTHTRVDQSVTLKQPLFDLPSIYDWKRRGLVEKSRQESVRSSEGDAYLNTVNAYLAFASTRVQADMALDYEAQLQELFKYVEKRAEAGAASNSDKERVRARSLNAHSSRLEQEAAHAAAGVEFVRLVNIAPEALRLPNMEDVGISVVPPTLQQAMPLAIESNPDVAVLNAELEAASDDKVAARGRYAPRFDLEYSYSDSLHAGGAAGRQNDQRLMLVMNWSVFNGGGDFKFTDEKIARYEEVKYRLDDQRRRVLQSLSAQYATLEATRKRIADGYRELESITTAARAMSSRMLSGNQSLLDMLDVYDRFYQARTRLVTLHVQEMGSVAQIARLVQGLPSKEALTTSAQPTADAPVPATK